MVVLRYLFLKLIEYLTETSKALVSSDMDIEMVISLPSGQDINVVSNDDILYSEDNVCSEDAFFLINIMTLL